MSHLSVLILWNCLSPCDNCLWSQNLPIFHISQQEVLSWRKMQTRHFQDILEDHGYIFTSISSLSSLATCQTHGHIWHFTCEACLRCYSLTCEAVGEHRLDVHKLNTAFSPKDMPIPMWIQDLSGKQRCNTELMSGAFCSGFLLPTPTVTWWLE